MFVSAIVPAAGRGARLKSSIPKPLVKITSEPILIRALKALGNNASIKEIILIVNKKDSRKLRNIVLRRHIKKIRAIVPGGKRRQDSVRNGLRYLDKRCDFVLIHDAARPFIDGKIISKAINVAKKFHAAVVGVALKPTIKRCNTKNRVVETFNRDGLFEIQTPQVFEKELILKAHKEFAYLDVTDDAALVEKLGVKPKLVQGSYFNIKITTPEDLIFAEAILKAQNAKRKAQGAKLKFKTFKL